MFVCFLFAAENKFALDTEMIHLIDLTALMALKEHRKIGQLISNKSRQFIHKQNIERCKGGIQEANNLWKIGCTETRCEEKFRDKRHSKRRDDGKVNRLDRP